MKSLIIKIVLAIIIVLLAYLVYESVQEPLRFNEKKEIIGKRGYSKSERYSYLTIGIQKGSSYLCCQF